MLFMPLRIERFGNKWDIFTWYVETCFRDTCAGLLQAESSQELRKELSPELKISSFASFGDGSLDFLNSRDFGFFRSHDRVAFGLQASVLSCQSFTSLQLWTDLVFLLSSLA